jgi:hypothetical protein
MQQAVVPQDPLAEGGARLGGMSKGELARRKKNERARTTAIWARLEMLAPNVDQNQGQPGFRSHFTPLPMFLSTPHPALSSVVSPELTQH